jgi:hypothetical protein
MEFSSDEPAILSARHHKNQYCGQYGAQASGGAEEAAIRFAFYLIEIEGSVAILSGR